MWEIKRTRETETKKRNGKRGKEKEKERESEQKGECKFRKRVKLIRNNWNESVGCEVHRETRDSCSVIEVLNNHWRRKSSKFLSQTGSGYNHFEILYSLFPIYQINERKINCF